jgi:PIN domain nuclease of toxin-antitoxin system
VRLLLDTHVALWAVVDDPRLPAKAAELIADPANDVFVSVASLWEIAIKHALARGKPHDMPISAREALGYFQAAGYVLLDVVSAHVIAVEDLPMWHADPFDRILVAQALAVPLRLLTHDTRVASTGYRRSMSQASNVIARSAATKQSRSCRRTNGPRASLTEFASSLRSSQ